MIFVGDSTEGLRQVESSTVASAVADPPYFKVLGGKDSWDYQWPDEDAYLKWCSEWFGEVYRVLRGNGHFWLWGYYDMLARCHPILLDAGFRHRETVLWDKGMQAVSGRATKKYKMYPNVTEFCVRYVKWNREELRLLLRARQKELGLTALQINEHMGVKTNGGGMWSIYTGNNVCAQIPTSDRWLRIMDIMGLDIPYSEVEMVWNTIPGLTNVWSDIAPDRRDRISPAQKPLEACRRLITPTTRRGDLVLDLFGGSLGVSKVAQRGGRRFVAVERDESLVREAVAFRGLETAIEVLGSSLTSQRLSKCEKHALQGRK